MQKQEFRDLTTKTRKELGRRVRLLRGSLSRRALGQKIGFDENLLLRLEKGEAQLSFERVVQLATGLSVEVGDLVDPRADELLVKKIIFKKDERIVPIFARRLREFRETRGLSQEAFARVMGLTQAQISSYEGGRVRPTLELVLAMKSSYNVDITLWILEGQRQTEQQHQQREGVSA